MRIGGFQKLTLLDYPGQVACIVFTGGCNFRCPFCHNSGLVLPGKAKQGETEEEILDYLRMRKGILDGVVITGGEPLLQADMFGFLEKIRELDYLIKLDTNGSFPIRLKALTDSGLIDYAAMDIKQTREKYELAAGVPASRVVPLLEESLDILRSSGLPFELRTTVVKGIHTREDLVEIAEWISGDQPYFLQPYVDSGSVLAPSGLSGYAKEELEMVLPDIRRFCVNASIR